jgi:hypothetical protein
MKHSILIFASTLAIGGCVVQPPPPAATATTAVTPAAHAAGSSANTTTVFDGTWVGGPIRNMSTAGNTLRAPGDVPNCPNYTTAPPITISGGLAQLDVINLRFQGYVTQQGALVMRTGAGQRLEGQIDPQNQLTGRVIGGCLYDASWKRS